MRKASMKVVNANANSSAHNSRINPPKYLLEDENFKENYYELKHTDDEFRKLAELKYLSTKKQKMQERQKVALIKETVLNLEERHTPEDVKRLFKNLNKEYGGHKIIELSIHRDEGHFEKDGIPYYPTKHILKKDDDWYIVPLEKFLDKDFKPTKKDFSKKVNINDFKKIKNIHAHVKFSMFDLSTGLTGRMSKGDVSKRLKFVADKLGLAYKPEQKINSGKAIKTVKDEHDLNRRSLIQKLYLKEQNKQLQENNTRLQYNFREMQKKITAMEELDKEQKKELHRLNTAVKNKELSIRELEEKIQELRAELLKKPKEVIKKVEVKVPVEVPVEVIKEVPVEVIKEVEKKIYVDVENPINTELQEKARKRKEKIRELEKTVQEQETSIFGFNKKEKELREALQSKKALETENYTLKSDLSDYKQNMGNLVTQNKALKDAATEALTKEQYVEIKEIKDPNSAIANIKEYIIANITKYAGMVKELKQKNKALQAKNTTTTSTTEPDLSGWGDFAKDAHAKAKLKNTEKLF